MHVWVVFSSPEAYGFVAVFKEGVVVAPAFAVSVDLPGVELYVDVVVFFEVLCDVVNVLRVFGVGECHVVATVFGGGVSDHVGVDCDDDVVVVVVCFLCVGVASE